MKAITLWQPYAWALFHGKPVENRPWRPNESKRGECIAIHAGKTYSQEGHELCCRLLGRESLPMAAGARGIVGTVVLDRFVRDDITGPDADDPILLSPWLFGPWGWVLRDQVEFKRPVPCAGALSLWTLPAAVEAVVMQAIEACARPAAHEACP